MFTLCTGTYNIKDNPPFGILIFNASNIVLDCNDATIIGTSNMYGDHEGYGIFAECQAGHLIQVLRRRLSFVQPLPGRSPEQVDRIVCRRLRGIPGKQVAGVVQPRGPIHRYAHHAERRTDQCIQSSRSRPHELPGGGVRSVGPGGVFHIRRRRKDQRVGRCPRLAGKGLEPFRLVARCEPDRVNHDHLLLHRIIGVNPAAVVCPGSTLKCHTCEACPMIPQSFREFGIRAVVPGASATLKASTSFPS